MSLLANKLTALTLAGALGVVSVGTISGVVNQNNRAVIQHNVVSQNNKPVMQNNTSKTRCDINNQTDEIVKLLKFVDFHKNGDITIKPSIYEAKNITPQEINLLKVKINSYLNIEKETKGNEFLAGVSFTNYGWGFTLSISPWLISAVLGDNGWYTALAIGAYLTAVISDPITGLIASALAGLIVTDISSYANQNEIDNGMTIQYHYNSPYLPYYQASWAD